jgi:exodeoxyribonuclease VII large subunit
MKGPAFPNVHYLRRVNTTPNILKLSELSAIVAGIFRMHFSGERYWVTAEIVGLKISRGHCYLQLVEKDEMGSTPKAEFRGIIWAGTYDRIHPRFVKTTGTPLREQMQVLLQVEVQYHERFGMSLVVQDIDPAFTLGQLEMERRQTIERLRKEGLLERNKSLDLPVSLQRIAVISAEDSKGYEDFVTRLNTNVYGYTFHLTLYTSLLQGDLAAGDILTKLSHIKTDLPVKDFDAVVIVRGGGGASSLECFNNYLLAAGIARFPLPVITGIGHQANKSVVDEVAHTDRMTPTDVANFLIEHQSAFEGTTESYWQQIREMAEEILRYEQEYVATSTHRLSSSVRLDLSKAGRTLDQSAFSLKHLLQGRLIHEQHTVEQFHQYLKKELLLFRQLETAALEEITSRLKNGITSFLQSNEQELINNEATVRLLDPAEVLRRGYSYTLYNGKAISNPEDVKDGDRITTVLQQGELQSIVNKK